MLWTWSGLSILFINIAMQEIQSLIYIAAAISESVVNNN